MMNNKADAIENYILERLAKKSEGKIELKRTTLAGEIDCAPSQISYVLSTRFTQERGFIVESRRGLGGYIRVKIITEVVDKKSIFEEILSKINPDTPFEGVKSMLEFLVNNKLIIQHDAELVAQIILNVYRGVEIAPTERAKFIRSIFKTLANLGD